MLKQLKMTAMALSLCVAGMAQAGSILVYEETGADGNKVEHTISITGRWLRIDSSAKGKPDYTLMDTGRMIMFEVDDSAKSYKVTRVGKFYWPEVPEPTFKPKMERTKVVSGIRCRQVQEMLPDKPAAEHCMASGSQLGLNAREIKTLSRLFVIARRIGWDWPNVSTPDERMASILSRNRTSGVSQQFVSVDHKGIPDNRVKIPDTYQRIMAEQKKPVKPKAPETTEIKSETKPEASVKPEPKPAVSVESESSAMPESATPKPE